MDFMEVVRRRRSIRKYKPDPISQDQLLSILEAARLAPSWANSQCWKFVVVTEPQARHALAKAGNEWAAHAPVMIAACADPSKPGTKGDQAYYMLDIGIAMEHIMLAAADQGLGTCWIGWFDEAVAKQALGVPDHIRVVAYTPLGVPDETPEPRPRKPMPDIWCLNRWEE